MSENEIINIVDPRVLEVPILECNETLVDLRGQGACIRPCARIASNREPLLFVRKGVYEKLCLAQNNLPQEWNFRIYEGFRSSKVQQILFE